MCKNKQKHCKFRSILITITILYLITPSNSILMNTICYTFMGLIAKMLNWSNVICSKPRLIAMRRNIRYILIILLLPHSSLTIPRGGMTCTWLKYLNSLFQMNVISNRYDSRKIVFQSSNILIVKNERKRFCFVTLNKFYTERI